MSYATLEAALKAKLITLSGFSSSKVTQGDDRIIGRGNSSVIIIYPGPFDIADDGQNRDDRAWTAEVDIFIRIKSDPGTDWGTFASTRDTIVSGLRAWPNLGQSGIFLKSVNVYARESPAYVNDDQGRGPFFIMQRLSVVMTESVTVSGGDYS